MTSDGYNAARDSVVRPSTRAGGTLRFGRTADFDSLDPGNTYYAFAWNFLRFIGRCLVTFRPAPGSAGQQLVPDLAESLGSASAGGKVWTYRLRRGVRFEDGSPVTARDVKYAIVRSNFQPEVLSGGPTYLRRYLGSPDAIEVPDRYTLVFRLAEPFAGFDLLASLPSTIPVPERLDRGPDYTLKPASCGPYRVQEYRRGERLVLVGNRAWRPATDPVRRRLADRIEVDLAVPGHELDRRLLAGEIDIDLAGVGVQPATIDAILADPALRRDADNPLIGYTWLYAINPKVPPLDDIHCRRAVQYATDKLGMQSAYGGPVAGEVASTVLPPTLPGHRPFDRYPGGPDHRGDPVAARAELAAAGRPDGFSVRIAARADRLKEFGAAQALCASLARVGIAAEVVPFRSSDYFDTYAGVPAYVHANGIGIIMFGWAADFPDGLGFLSQITDGRAIKASGNHNFAEIDMPEVNALLDRGAQTTEPPAREAIWSAIDRLVMEEAYLCPYLYAKSLLFRSPRVRNVYVTGAYGMYDYVSLSIDEADLARTA
jgi:peptide/nickel transport system substrate-binding protein